MQDQIATNEHQLAPGGANASAWIGKSIAIEARISTGGLLAVAAIVTASLLGSAAIVLASRRRRDAG